MNTVADTGHCGRVRTDTPISDRSAANRAAQSSCARQCHISMSIRDVWNRTFETRGSMSMIDMNKDDPMQSNRTALLKFER